jgi:hypothetical protein
MTDGRYLDPVPARSVVSSRLSTSVHKQRGDDVSSREAGGRVYRRVLDQKPKMLFSEDTQETIFAS